MSQPPIISVVPPAEEFFPGCDQSNPMLFLTTDVQPLYTDPYHPESHRMGMDGTENQFPLTSGQMSPLIMEDQLNGLRDVSGGNNMFLNDVEVGLDKLAGRASPLEAWSPISSSSGDGGVEHRSQELATYSSTAFPDGQSDSSLWSPYMVNSTLHSYPTSPNLSPSLSPIDGSFNNISISDNEDNLAYLPNFSQHPRDLSPIGDRMGRPMSPADFTFTFENADSPVPPISNLSPQGQWNSMALGVDYGNQLETSELQYANEAYAIPALSNSSHRPRSASLGGQVNFGDATDPQPINQTHGDYLTVPTGNQLQRRHATHRRNHTHSGINNFPESAGRGRSPTPHARGYTGRPHSLGRINEQGAHAQRLQGMQIQTNNLSGLTVPTVESSSPGTPYSSSSSNYSPSFDTPNTPSDHSPITPGSPYSTSNVNILPPHDVGLARRSSESISHSPRMVSTAELQRHTSDSSGLRRSKSRSSSKLGHRRVRSGNYDAYTSVFKNNKSTTSLASTSSLEPMSPFENFSPSDSNGQIMLPLSDLGASHSQDEQDFRATVASDKIVAAAEKRRIHQARFKCDLCPATFTARHNLNNHMNSHTGEKPFKCQFCGQAAVTQAVVIRHERNSCKLRQKVKTKRPGH